MTILERIGAARHVLADLDEAAALRANVFLRSHGDEAHDRLRAYVLRALESLDPGLSATSSSERRYRHYQILTRCDLQGEPHKEVAAALGLSRRQFYRERREAFLGLADALESAEQRSQIEFERFDALSMQLDYVQNLREQGRYDAVWRESLRALRDMDGDAREVEVWTVAAEAARHFGNLRQAQEAVEHMHRCAAASVHEHLRRASALRIAIVEMLLDWVQGDPQQALARLRRVAAECGSERSMYGRDATLFAILLTYGASIDIECGKWHEAKEFIARAERIVDRSEVPYARALQQRLRGRIALSLDGNISRATVEMRDSLAVLQTHKVMPTIAVGAVEYGLALVHSDAKEGWRYIDYGLSMAHDVCGYDECAVLTSLAAPLLVEYVGAEAALRSLNDVRGRSPLSARADLYVGVAEMEIRFSRGEFETVIDRGRVLGEALEKANFLPAAAKARVVTAESVARTGKPMQARRLLAAAGDLIGTYAEQATKLRAKQIGTTLAL